MERMQPVSITTPWITQFVFVLRDMLVMALNVSHSKQGSKKCPFLRPCIIRYYSILFCMLCIIIIMYHSRYGHVSFPVSDGIILMGGWSNNSRLNSELVKFNGKVKEKFKLKYKTL